MDFKLRNTVDKVGAPSGSILLGAVRNNKGLRLKIFESQSRGHGGAIRGRFEILDFGDNKHSPALQGLLGASTDAEEVLHLIRQEHAMCINVVNANTLTAEVETNHVQDG